MSSSFGIGALPSSHLAGAATLIGKVSEVGGMCGLHNALDQACVMLALAGARSVRPELLMLGAVGCIHALW